MADEALQDPSQATPPLGDGSASAEAGDGVSGEPIPATEGAVPGPDDNADHGDLGLRVGNLSTGDGGQEPPPLVMPEGLTFLPACTGCGLQFAEPLGNRPCPNCGTPVI